MFVRSRFDRRSFLKSSAATGLVAASSLFMPALSRAQSRPRFTHGVQSGDVDASSGMVWVRADRPARLEFEWATTESFKEPTRLHGLDATPNRDLAVKRLLTGLPSDQEIFWRSRATDLTDGNARSDWITGHFRTAPTERRTVRFAWSGDTAGQGWGIDESRGGMKTYASMNNHDLDFFIHSGDTIYADGPIEERVDLEDGGTWKNIVTPEKSKVAETLDEYRGQWKYNLLDENLKALNAFVPTFFQWDDHEVVNNWSSSKDLTGDDRYRVKDVMLLASRAGQAFHEMTPIRYQPEEPGRVYRTIHYGPLVDIFFLDLRSYRSGNSVGLQETRSDETRILGDRQIAWLKTALTRSTATWKVIASDMPIGLQVWDNQGDERFVEAIANGDAGSPKGRELEIAEILRFIKAEGVLNTVWLTADVHYTAAHHYSPDRAAFQDFEPFREFVSGPIHSGTFGPNDLDATFGPQVRFVKAPEDGRVNLPPSEGLQFFGLVEIDGDSEALTVRLMDRDDNELWTTTLEPQHAA
ncbi:alkaline phosphatase D family protein [Fulvimarina sp. 2208YS6-2-32]|uniref:Alkaline phosphatase D family protein n=1 Tax=Fulvimarina uroteuthidis TaxID=3098149 RepID=A0ABU5I188_9HYPH|nr:alkaline phosphatase D family protein [Fulvimarina sp. 2208YS6-2-32]MDY8108579.1 alkaline phosphatase D family protein [Fulvimarina sp. 2208YS6-2-32]